jgi:hypothetical protein
MLLKAIHNHLIQDPMLIPKLGYWNPGSGNEPCVFAKENVLPSMPAPYITITQDGGIRNSLRGGKIEKVTHRLTLVGHKSLSQRYLRSLADLIVARLDRIRLTVPGYTSHYSVAGVPQQTTTPNGLPGFVVMVESTLLKKET